jgi:hypothetical protein
MTRWLLLWLAADALFVAVLYVATLRRDRLHDEYEHVPRTLDHYRTRTRRD